MKEERKCEEGGRREGKTGRKEGGKNGREGETSRKYT